MASVAGTGHRVQVRPARTQTSVHVCHFTLKKLQGHISYFVTMLKSIQAAMTSERATAIAPTILNL